jgi:DNA-binding MarR family transcriptional regulator
VHWIAALGESALKSNDSAGPAGPADTEEPLHRRLETPRLFKLLSLIRRAAAPGVRRDLGLSDFEWRIMSQVGDRAPMSLNELAAITSHDKGQLSRGVKRLVEAGLLIRESRRGERGVFISPTRAGHALFDRLAAQAAQRNEKLIRGLTSEELSVLSRVIDKLEANALDMLAAEQCGGPEA